MRAVAEYDIYFNRPSFEGREREYMAQALDAGHISGNGGFTKRAEACLAQLLGVPKVLLTTSCTDALELAALLLFVSTANAFALRGARPVFADVREDTLNLDEARLEDLVGPRTKAIVPVHYAGVGCEMDAIQEVAQGAGAAVVEDNAHGLFGRYRGRLLGTFGRLAAQSFHETKNITCGEGGALVINDESLVDLHLKLAYPAASLIMMLLAVPLTAAGTRVLLLEDEPTIREILLDIFGFEGFEVTVCSTLAELRAAIAQQPGCVVVSDSWGPLSSVLDDRLRAEIIALGKSAPVILIPAQMWASDVVAEELGVTIVPKPFELDGLVQAVKQVIASNERQ